MYVLLAALLWSSGGVLIKLANWSPLGIASLRSAIAAVIISTYYWWRWGRVPRLVPRQPAEWLAAFGYAATVILFVWATKLTTAANAIVLQYSAPLYVALLGWLVLGEKLSSAEWLLLGLMMTGILLFFGEQLSPSGMVGNLLAIGSGIGMAIMTLAVRVLQKHASATEALVMGNVIAALAGIATWHELVRLDSSTLAVLGILGIVQLGIPYILFAHALASIRAIEAVMLAMLEPIANPLWVMLIVGEHPTVWSAVGGVLVIGATGARAILSYSRSSSREDSSGSSG